MEGQFLLKMQEPLEIPTAKPVAVPPAKKPWSPLWKLCFCWLIVACLSYFSFFLISTFVLQSVLVVGNSMSPTLQDSHRYILNRWVYHVRDPKPGDIVVLRDPADNGYSVKRIIAKAGDSVYFKGGHLFVNGKELSEPYLSKGMPTYPGPETSEQLFVCGSGKYFVLGDNRINSCDSRVYNGVPRENILGLVVP